VPLQENAFNYDKGVLAEILEPIMGKGLIPADLETWKVRRRAIVPGAYDGGGRQRRRQPASVGWAGLGGSSGGAEAGRGTQASAAGNWGTIACLTCSPYLRSSFLPFLPPAGFHKAYLDTCIDMFGRVSMQTVAKLDATISAGAAAGTAGAAGGKGQQLIDMETEFLNLGLDIIGLGVFNYDFGSITAESPVIKASRRLRFVVLGPKCPK
jgi:hypothetical protein